MARSRRKFAVLTLPLLLVACAPTGSADEQRIEQLEQQVATLNAEVVTVRAELTEVAAKLDKRGDREARLDELREMRERRRLERSPDLRDPFTGDDTSEPAPDPGPPTPLPMPGARSDVPEPDPVAALVDTVKCEPGKCSFSRKALDAVLSNPAALAKTARVVPMIRDGETKGFKFYGIRRGSLPKAIGMKNGDMVTSVNGQEMSGLDQAMAMYTKLRDAKSIELLIERKGKRHTLVLEAK